MEAREDISDVRLVAAGPASASAAMIFAQSLFVSSTQVPASASASRRSVQRQDAEKTSGRVIFSASTLPIYRFTPNLIS